MASEKLTIEVSLDWDPETEDPRQALGAVFAAMGRSVPKGKREGQLLAGGAWRIGKGGERWGLPSAE